MAQRRTGREPSFEEIADKVTGGLAQQAFNQAVREHGVVARSAPESQCPLPVEGQDYRFMLKFQVDPEPFRPVSIGLEIEPPPAWVRSTLKKDRWRKSALDALVKANPVPIPAARLRDTAALIESNSKKNGTLLDATQVWREAQKVAAGELLVSWVAQYEGIHLRPEAVEQRLTAIARGRRLSMAEVRRRVNIGELEANLLREQVLDWIVANSNSA